MTKNNNNRYRYDGANKARGRTNHDGERKKERRTPFMYNNPTIRTGDTTSDTVTVKSI